MPKPNDLVEDLGHHARVRPGSGRCHLADCRAAATTAGRDEPTGVSAAPGSGRVCFGGSWSGWWPARRGAGTPRSWPPARARRRATCPRRRGRQP